MTVGILIFVLIVIAIAIFNYKTFYGDMGTTVLMTLLLSMFPLMLFMIVTPSYKQSEITTNVVQGEHNTFVEYFAQGQPKHVVFPKISENAMKRAKFYKRDYYNLFSQEFRSEVVALYGE